MPTTTAIRGLAAAGAALTLMVGLSGCSVLSSILGNEPARDEEGAVTETDTSDVFAMAVGDCLNEPSGTQVSEVEFVPCDQPHDYEVYAELELPAGDYPTDVDAQAETYCTEQFTSFVGVSFDESTLSLTYFTPTMDSWGEGDHLVSCIIVDPAGQTTGTLAGANK